MGPRHFAVSSDLVHGELRETLDAQLRRSMVRRYLRSAKRLIPSTPKVRRIAWEIIGAGAVTENHLADAFHIAYSMVGRAYALVTWDANHLAREHARRAVREYCWRHGLPELRIGTPIEVGRWLDVKIP
jgi:histone H3/H4